MLLKSKNVTVTRVPCRFVRALLDQARLRLAAISLYSPKAVKHGFQTGRTYLENSAIARSAAIRTQLTSETFVLTNRLRERAGAGTEIPVPAVLRHDGMGATSERRGGECGGADEFPGSTTGL